MDENEPCWETLDVAVYLDPLAQPQREGHVSTQVLVAPWEAHARQHPDRIAVQALDEGEAWTWGQMAQAAHMLALEMKGVGVLPGARVALTLPASAEWIVAVWATWICEGVWCPIPDTLPPVRQQEILRQLDPQVIYDGKSVLSKGSPREKCIQGSAYILYNLENTGKPKGVLVSADGLNALWGGQIEVFGITPNSRVAWMPSPAFDAIVAVGAALTAGATVFPVPRGRWSRWKRCHEDMATWHIDQLHASSRWLSLFAGRVLPPSLKTIISGGEATPAAILYPWATRVRWLHVYGAPEASTSAGFRHLLPGQSMPHTLGSPFDPVRYRLVPLEAQDPLPFLTQASCNEGELWIGGPTVALGYWKDPELTRAHFCTAEGLRWFRTGDAVRHDRGQWEFLGRMDRQVKVRGQLLHLDETEQVIASLPNVGVCVAFVDAEEKLVAIVSQTSPDNGEIHQWAQQHLPPWGVPQHIVRLEEWPLTISGKVDRKRVVALFQAGD